MAYESFRAELDAKYDNIMHVADVEGKLFVEFIGDDAPGYEFAPDYGYELLGELDEETAAENGAAEGCKVAIFAEGS